MVDVAEAQDESSERGRVAADGEHTQNEHPAWCCPNECYWSEGVRVHQQEQAVWEDETAEVRCESRLFDPTDDPNIYLELCLRSLSSRVTCSMGSCRWPPHADCGTNSPNTWTLCSDLVSALDSRPRHASEKRVPYPWHPIVK